MNKINIGDEIEIVDMMDEPQYCGRTGTVTHIDALGQIHGTWGGLALLDGDSYIITKHAAQEGA